MNKEGSERTLIIAPWGNPRYWVYTHYIIYIDERAGLKIEKEGFTSLSVLSQLYPNSKVIIFAPDTLVVDIIGSSQNIGSYDVITYDNVKRMVEKWLRKYICCPEADIFILPGTIQKGSSSVIGAPIDYRMFALKSLIDVIWREKPGQIVLDLTHGLNYMTAMTLDATLEAYAYYRNLIDHEAKLAVYNSDPVISSPSLKQFCGRSNKDSNKDPCVPADPDKCSLVIPRSTLHEVIRGPMGRISLIAYLEDAVNAANDPIKPIEKPPDEIIKEAKDLGTNSRDLFKKAKILLRMVRYGLIPELLYFTWKNNKFGADLKDIQDKVIGLWEKGIRINAIGSGGVEIKRVYKIDEGFRLLLVASLIYSKVADSLHADDGGPTLKTAWDIAKELYGDEGLLGLIQKREKEKIDKSLETIRGFCKSGDKIDLSTLLGMAGVEKEHCEIFRRNLMAHGGWHTGIISLECINGSLDNPRLIVREEDVCSGEKTNDLWSQVNNIIKHARLR